MSLTGLNVVGEGFPSMKVPPKRKGNRYQNLLSYWIFPLNESPSEKEGKCGDGGSAGDWHVPLPLNESPSEKEGKFRMAVRECG